MLETGKKCSHKQGKGNLWGHTCADIGQEFTTSSGESAKELMIREMHLPRQAILAWTGHDPTSTKPESCRNIL